VQAREKPSAAPPAETQVARPPTAPAPSVSEATTEAAKEEKPAAPPPPVVKKVEYERILGSFAIDPELLIYYTPDLMARHHVRADPERFAALAESLRAAGARRAEAGARLDLGAVLWSGGQAEKAYREMMRAQGLFAELGDVDGLAHAYEWLGFFFRESGSEERAAEHLSVAYRMFQVLENHAAAERVLGYAGPPAARP
jgi:hypothetical protein